MVLLLGHYDGQVKLPCFDTHFPCDPKKRTLFSYGAGHLLKNGNHRRLEQELCVRNGKHFDTIVTESTPEGAHS